MRKVFVINGLPGAGKTLFGKMVGEELALHRMDFLHTSSIDLVKQVLLPGYLWDEVIVPRELWGALAELKREVTDLDWDGGVKDVYWRGVMSRLKGLIGLKYPNLINEWLWSRVMSVDETGWVFADIREPENIKSFRDFCNEMRIGMPVRTVCVTGDTHDEFDNPSDARVGDYPYDIFVVNKRLIHGGDNEAALRGFRQNVITFVNEELRSSRALERE
jgi:hypothetical protein